MNKLAARTFWAHSESRKVSTQIQTTLTLMV